MTIVLQHRFWDLAVDDERFEVKLTFDGIPERLVVPFAAVKVFYDPSVPYVLQFEEVDMGGQGDAMRRGPRRAPGQARQPGTGPGATAAEPADASSGANALRVGTDADTTPDRGDRRRPPRRNRPEREAAEAAEEARPGVDALQPAERAPAQPVAPPPAAEKPVTAPPAAAAPGAKPAIVAVGKSPDEAAKPDDDKASPGAGGAKIFDLSKFRGKK
jgi:hypothetical protein